MDMQYLKLLIPWYYVKHHIYLSMYWGYVDPKMLRSRCLRKLCNGGVPMYLHAREIVSFLQSIHVHFELNTFTINSALLSDTLI